MRNFDLILSGFEREEWNNIHPLTLKENRKVLIGYCLIAAFVCIMAYGSSKLVGLENSTCIVLVFSGVISMTIAIFEWLFANKYTWIVTAGMLAFSAIITCLGIVVSTCGVDSNNTYAVTFMIILMVLPLLFTIKPIAIAIALIVGIVLFNLSAFANKDIEYALYDLYHSLVYGTLSMILGIYTDRVKLKRLELEYLRNRSLYTDELTGLGSRRKYSEDIARFSDVQVLENVTVIFLDVNGLKRTNDSIGHMAGDELICKAAMCIKKAFGSFGSCYRVGGDEFVCIIENMSYTQEEYQALLDKVLRLYYGTLEENITIACGVARSVDMPNLEIRDLVEAADEAMYENKRWMHKQTY